MTSHIQRLGIIPRNKKTKKQRLSGKTFAGEHPKSFCFWGNILKDEANSYKILMRFIGGDGYLDVPMPFRFMRRMTIGTSILDLYPQYRPPDKNFHTVFFSPYEADLVLLSDCPGWIKDNCFYQGRQDCIGEQPVFRFKQEDQMYYLPAMEFIRKCFVTNSLCCDDFIYPGRMEAAIRYKEERGEQLILHLLRRYRKAYITKGTALFLARWYSNLAFRISFNSVANESVLLPQSSNHPLRFQPPKIGQVKLTCVLESRQKRHWITRIIDVKDIPVSVREVVVYQGVRKSGFRVG